MTLRETPCIWIIEISEHANWKNQSIDIDSSIYKPIKNDEIDEVQFKTWLQKKEDLNKNIKKVCDKYGKTLRHIEAIKSSSPMYDEEHNLLLTLNAKVANISICFLFAKLPNPKSLNSGTGWDFGHLYHNTTWALKLSRD